MCEQKVGQQLEPATATGVENFQFVRIWKDCRLVITPIQGKHVQLPVTTATSTSWIVDRCPPI